MANNIEDIEGIGAVYAEKLQAAGVKTTADLAIIFESHIILCCKTYYSFLKEDFLKSWGSEWVACIAI